jgi:uncharacterized protein with HEPN domain
LWQGLDQDSFRSDRRSIYAVTRCLEIISEASRRLSAEIVARHPTIPWHQIRAAGNHCRHEYDNVSPGVPWTSVHHSLGDLERAVVVEIEAMDRS